MTDLMPSPKMTLILFAVVMLVLLIVCAPMLQKAIGAIPMDIPVKVPPLTREGLAALPLTNHARYDHPERAMGAEAIREVMLARKCSPVELYYCPATDTMIVTCPANDKVEFGLWIGATNKAVVTGFPFDRSRLDKQVTGCIGPIDLP